jgi:hypothetical protein
MFASVNFNLIMSIAIMTGCAVSKPFAAAVVCGAFGVFIACVVIFSRKDNSSTVDKVVGTLRSWV